MGTLTTLMNLSREALQADQTALSVTSSNVANQNTVGYTRQVVSWRTVDSVTLTGPATGGSEGVPEGVAATATSQRDRVLEQRVQQQTQVQAQSGALAGALESVQSIFGISSSSTSAGSTALGLAIDSLFSSFAALEGSPGGSATRQSVLAAAGTLAATLNSAAGQIAQVSAGLDAQVNGSVGRINALTATIAGLNVQIAGGSAGQDAGALEDQRQQAIAALSQFVGLDQIATDHNGVALTTSNGAMLVSGGESFALTTTRVGGVAHLLSGADGVDITSGLKGGSLGGLLRSRDQVLPRYADALDQLAYGIGTQVNLQSALGVDGAGAAGQAMFSLPGSAAGAAALMSVAQSDPQQVAARAAGEGSAGSGNALALADLGSANVVQGQTAAGYYAAFLGQIGNDTAGATTDSTAQQAILTQLTTQRNALSGVSLDEEAANLTQYQRSYEAAAKVLAIVNTLLASAINLGVQTSVN